MTSPILTTLLDEDALRDHLDALNEEGEITVVVGWDTTPQPFLITLVGAYADREDVLFGSPWQGDLYSEKIDDVWVPKLPHCEECQGQVHTMKDLKFPVMVMVAE